jgi:hypothetical protein
MGSLRKLLPRNRNINRNSLACNCLSFFDGIPGRGKYIPLAVRVSVVKPWECYQKGLTPNNQQTTASIVDFQILKNSRDNYHPASVKLNFLSFHILYCLVALLQVISP